MLKLKNRFGKLASICFALTALCLIFGQAEAVASSENKKRSISPSINKEPGTAVIRGETYRYKDGKFFKKGLNGFNEVPPPPGLVLSHLPENYETLSIGRDTYYFKGNTYLKKIPASYMVVKNPVHLEKEEEKIPPEHSQLSVIPQNLNVRSGPGTSQPVIARIHRGTTLTVKGYATGWYLVMLPSGTSGWVSQDFTRPLPLHTKK